MLSAESMSHHENGARELGSQTHTKGFNVDSGKVLSLTLHPSPTQPGTPGLHWP